MARGGPTVPPGGQATITARWLASRSCFKRSSSLFRNSSCAVPTLSAASVLASCLGERISGQLGAYGMRMIRSEPPEPALGDSRHEATADNYQRLVGETGIVALATGDPTARERFRGRSDKKGCRTMRTRVSPSMPPRRANACLGPRPVSELAGRNEDV